MNFDDVTAIQIPEGNVKSIAIGGVTVWEAPVVDKYTWDAVFASIDKGTYATDYAIGDTVPLDLGTEGVINMQIAAFDTDDLADGSGKAPITWIVENLMTDYMMNPENVDDSECTGTIGGWEKCEMRSYLNDTIKPMMPDNVLNRIKQVKKTQLAYDAAGTKFEQTTLDDVWIPSVREMFGTVTDSESTGPTYTGFFNSNESRKKRKPGQSSYYNWWLRTAYDKNRFNQVNYGGGKTSLWSMNKASTILGFCT